MNPQIYAKCDGYLDNRTGDYEYRTKRYDAVIDVIEENGGLGPDMTIADVAAGWTEFGHRLTQRGFRGRYLPFDGAIDGKDLQMWQPPATRIDWIVAIEFLEHLLVPVHLVEVMFDKAKKGVIITTPNSAEVDTLGMDGDHVTALHIDDLHEMGFENVRPLHLFPGTKWAYHSDALDTLVAW